MDPGASELGNFHCARKCNKIHIDWILHGLSWAQGMQKLEVYPCCTDSLGRQQVSS